MKAASVLLLSVCVYCTDLSGADANPQLLARGQGANAPRQPQVSVSDEGVVDLVYTIGNEIIVATSQDRGRSYQRSAATIRCPNMAAGMRRGPRVARTDEALVVTAIGGEQGRGRDGDLFSWRSTDNGATWSAAVKVNDVSTSAREGLHGMAVGPKGDLWCVWLDLRSSKSEIFTATSTDSGQTWTANERTYQSPGGSVCECCHPSIVAGKQGALIMFRNSLQGERDMYLVRTTDGRGFSGGTKLGQKSWLLDACPMDGGMLAFDGQDKVVTVWQRDDHVYATFANQDAEVSLGPGRQPWAAWSSSGPILTWTQGREGPLFVQMGTIVKARTIAPVARFPVVASNPSCDFAVVAWESKEGDDSLIFTQLFTTSGVASGNAQNE